MFAYHTILDESEIRTTEDQVEINKWKVNKIITYKGRGNNTRVKARWNNDTTSWIPLKTLRLHDPDECCKFASKHNLYNEKGWEWTKEYNKIKDKQRNILNAKRS